MELKFCFSLLFPEHLNLFSVIFFQLGEGHLLGFTEKTRSYKFLLYLCCGSKTLRTQGGGFELEYSQFLPWLSDYFLPLFPSGSHREPVVYLLGVCSVAGEGVGEAAVPLPNLAVWRVTGPAFLLHLDLALKLRSIPGLLLYWQQDF